MRSRVLSYYPMELLTRALFGRPAPGSAERPPAPLPFPKRSKVLALMVSRFDSWRGFLRRLPSLSTAEQCAVWCASTVLCGLLPSRATNGVVQQGWFWQRNAIQCSSPDRFSGSIPVLVFTAQSSELCGSADCSVATQSSAAPRRVRFCAATQCNPMFSVTHRFDSGRGFLSDATRGCVWSCKMVQCNAV